MTRWIRIGNKTLDGVYRPKPFNTPPFFIPDNHPLRNDMCYDPYAVRPEDPYLNNKYTQEAFINLFKEYLKEHNKGTKNEKTKNRKQGARRKKATRARTHTTTVFRI